MLLSLSLLRRSLRKKPAAAEAAADAKFAVDVVLLFDGDRERRRASFFDLFFFLPLSFSDVEGGGGGGRAVTAVSVAIAVESPSNPPPPPLPCPRIVLLNAITRATDALEGEGAQKEQQRGRFDTPRIHPSSFLFISISEETAVKTEEKNTFPNFLKSRRLQLSLLPSELFESQKRLSMGDVVRNNSALAAWREKEAERE